LYMSETAKSEHYKRYQKRKAVHARMSRNAQNRDDKSLRNRIGGIGWRSKADMIAAIQRAVGCDRPGAERHFTTARTAKKPIIVYNKEADTWASAGIAEHNHPPKPRAIRTHRQQEQWDKWSFVPDLASDKEAEKSELFRHQVAAGVFPNVQKAKDEHHRANNGTRSNELKPTCMIRLNGRQVVHGKNYYLPGTVRDANEKTFEEMANAFRNGYIQRLAKRLGGGSGTSEKTLNKKMAGFEPERLVGQAIACGDLIPIDISPDYFGDQHGQFFILIGADSLAKIQEQKTAQKALKAAADEKRSEINARITELDEMAKNHHGADWDKFMDQVIPAMDNVYRLRRMHLFQYFRELEISFPDMNLRRAVSEFSDEKHGSKREMNFTEFMLECKVITQVSVRDEAYNCDRVAYHGADITFEEAKALRDCLKATAEEIKRNAEQMIKQAAQLQEAA
jgi:hypothetical protein